MTERNRVTTDEELIQHAEEALSIALNVVVAVKSRTTNAAFILPLLHEGNEAARVAHSALLELQRRAVGVKPPKIGE